MRILCPSMIDHLPAYTAYALHMRGLVGPFLDRGITPLLTEGNSASSRLQTCFLRWGKDLWRKKRTKEMQNAYCDVAKEKQNYFLKLLWLKLSAGAKTHRLLTIPLPSFSEARLQTHKWQRGHSAPLRLSSRTNLRNPLVDLNHHCSVPTHIE